MYRDGFSNDATLQRVVAEKSSLWKVRSRTRPGQEYYWVAINHDEPRVGAPPVKPSQRSRKIVDSDVLRDHDWSLNSDYWDASRPYRAYIPLYPDSTGFPQGHWVAALEAQGRKNANAASTWRLDPEMAANVFATREHTHTLVQAVTSTYMPPYTIPPSVSLWWINTYFPTEAALAAKIADVRRGILDQYGFIVYNLVRDPDWNTRPLLVPLVGKITDTGLVRCSFRGCIVDFNEIAHDDLLNLLNDQVPVHYQWFPTDVGPFDPRTLKAEDYDDLNRERYQTQERERDQTAERLDLLTGEVCTVFKDDDDDEEASGAAVSRVGGAEAVLSQTQTRTHRDVTPTVEGTPVVTLGVTNAAPSQAHAETAHKQMGIVADMQVVLPGIKNANVSRKDRRAETDFSLEEDTGPIALQFPSVPAIACLPYQFSPRQPPLHPPAFIPNTQNPQSPSVLLPCKEGLRRIRSAYGADARLIIGPPVCLRGITFPATPAPRLGTLVMPFQSAIRVAHDIYIDPAASATASVPTLLQRGASYRVLVPRSQVIRVPSTVNYLRYLNTRNTYPRLLNLKDPNYWNVYLAQVQALLRRPYARRFLTLGGILWRLALQFGPPSLLNQALAGPSSDVMIWGIGDVVDGQWDDSVTAADIATLIGVSEAGSCWPPHDVWNASCRWKGFWSDADEKWFQSHLRNLSSGNAEAGKTRKDWKRFFRPISTARSSDASIYGSEAFARELFGRLGFRIDLVPTWDLSVNG
jgi:hypothetical protein